MQRSRKPEGQQQEGGEAARELHMANEGEEGGVVNPAGAWPTWERILRLSIPSEIRTVPRIAISAGWVVGRYTASSRRASFDSRAGGGGGGGRGTTGGGSPAA